jgi:thiol-disulfide isomerase/thioredoxin
MIYPKRSMSTSTNKILLVALLGLAASLNSIAQSAKPEIYIDPQGRRYTSQQFDSVRTANMGKPIAVKDRSEREKEVELTFEVLSVDPFDTFIKKWVGQPLPAFALKDVNGKTHSNKTIQGKLTVINFWSVTCAPCLLEMPHLSELVDKYSDQGVIFLAPAPEELSRVQKALSKRRFAYTVLPQAQKLFAAVGIDSYPYHLIVDTKGIIKDIYHGSQFDTKTNQPILDKRLITSIDAGLKD